jgi:hypothetical protein
MTNVNKNHDGSRHTNLWYEDDCELTEFHSGGADWQVKERAKAEQREADFVNSEVSRCGYPETSLIFLEYCV